jgi:hypothetical protein
MYIPRAITPTISLYLMLTHISDNCDIMLVSTFGNASLNVNNYVLIKSNLNVFDDDGPKK